MLIPAIVIGGIVVFTDLSIIRAYFKDGKLVRDFRFFYRIYASIAFLYLIAGTISFILKYIRTTVYIYKLQMRYLFVGSSFAIVLAAVCSIVLPSVFNYSELYAIGPAVASFLVTAALFYSVIAFNIMEITTAIHKTSMYLTLSTVIFLPVYLFVYLHNQKNTVFDHFPSYLVALFIVAVFIFFSVYIQPLIDRLFRRKQFQFERIMDNFILNVEKDRDPETVIRKTVDVLYKSLFLKRAFFMLLNEKTRKYELFYYTGDGSKTVESMERNSILIRWFVRNQDMLLRQNIYRDNNFEGIRDQFVEFYEKNETRIVIPVYHAKRVIGLLCMGSKNSLSAFTPDEIQKLKFFHQQCNEYISTALSYEQAIKEQLVQRTIELSSEILAKSVPVSLPNLKGIKFGAFVIPKYADGIDYFDFIRPGKHGVGIIATNVSGAGVNSSLYSIIMRSIFQFCINEAPSTYSVMKTINNVLFNYTKGKGELITAYYLYYDTKFMRLMYTNAGFPALEVFRVEKNDFDSLDTEGIPLGYDPKTTYGIGRTNLLRGDIGVLYSKSLINSQNQNGEVFGLIRLRKIIKDNRAGRPAQISEIIKNSFIEFMGLSSYSSDIITLIFKIV